MKSSIKIGLLIGACFCSYQLMTPCEVWAYGRMVEGEPDVLHRPVSQFSAVKAEGLDKRIDKKRALFFQNFPQEEPPYFSFRISTEEIDQFERGFEEVLKTEAFSLASASPTSIHLSVARSHMLGLINSTEVSVGALNDALAQVNYLASQFFYPHGQAKRFLEPKNEVVAFEAGLDFALHANTFPLQLSATSFLLEEDKREALYGYAGRVISHLEALERAPVTIVSKDQTVRKDVYSALKKNLVGLQDALSAIKQSPLFSDVLKKLQEQPEESVFGGDMPLVAGVVTFATMVWATGGKFLALLKNGCGRTEPAPASPDPLLASLDDTSATPSTQGPDRKKGGGEGRANRKHIFGGLSNGSAGGSLLVPRFDSVDDALKVTVQRALGERLGGTRDILPEVIAVQQRMARHSGTIPQEGGAAAETSRVRATGMTSAAADTARSDVRVEAVRVLTPERQAADAIHGLNEIIRSGVPQDARAGMLLGNLDDLLTNHQEEIQEIIGRIGGVLRAVGEASNFAAHSKATAERLRARVKTKR